MKTVSKSREPSKSSKETAQIEEAAVVVTIKVAAEAVATTTATNPLPAVMPLAATLMSKEEVAGVAVVGLKIVRKLYPLT